MSKSKRGAYKDNLRIQADSWAERMIQNLNAGFAARYGPSAYTTPDTTMKLRAPKAYYGLHSTKGYGPPYVRRGKRSNS